MASRPPRQPRPPGPPPPWATPGPSPAQSYSTTPSGSQWTSPSPPSLSPTSYPERPFLLPNQGAGHNVSFHGIEQGDRQAPVPLASSSYPTLPHREGDPEKGSAGAGADFIRKKSLVRPDREKIEPGHRQWHYRNAVQEDEDKSGAGMRVLPSTTGNYPQRGPLRRGRSLLARDQDVHESGLTLFKRGTLGRRRSSTTTTQPSSPAKLTKGRFSGTAASPWLLYCQILTLPLAPSLLRTCFGLRTPERQRAFREKLGLLSLILVEMALVGFITFGFTEAVCGQPPNRYHGGRVGTDGIGETSVVVNGWDYDFGAFHHPATPDGAFDGTANPVFEGNWGLGGNDASFLFQKTNQNCLGIVTRPPSSQIPSSGGGESMDWYFPCNVRSQYGAARPNMTGATQATNCHVSSKGQLATMKPMGAVYLTWSDVRNTSRRLAVFESSVLDLELLDWLDPTQITVPAMFSHLAPQNDLTMQLMRLNARGMGHCLQDLITVGFIDTKSIGCVASEVLLYLSLIFIVGVVLIRFGMAVLFGWFVAPKIGGFPSEGKEERLRRAEEIEVWSNDIYKPAPSGRRPTVEKGGLRPYGKKKNKTLIPSTSRFTVTAPKTRPMTTYDQHEYSSSSVGAGSSAGSSSFFRPAFSTSPSPSTLSPNVIPQPPPDYEPFNFPLVHTICLVTAYSESVEGLRTTLDSLATTDYPNSHKLIVIIADGMVKGAGNEMTTPDICLQMMRDFVVPPDQVEAHSYVAIADGHKRHNMAKVFAGWYAYDDQTIERSKQQRCPILLVAKVGNPLEARDAKPGNRGKRDSQIVLMSFLQKVMFDERMTTLEYELFNALWSVTGVSPDRYELALCVDADTKVFPDSVTRMVSCMVSDHEIMGLCGETKVANKAETWVTMMQVFEYYISHHMTKAFESMFGGVTCLPGCFSMYRIKAPKGSTGFWVPILANPDIVSHYSENVVDTLHKKNLLLLGEDRYLTTLMLKTFPKRKNMFCPSAVCKTVVPNTFGVLLSQRRRWINSTIHNLFELVLVRDLCGTFCFSMQFVVGMELAGTLVLPAAISFTLYLIIQSIVPGGPNTTIPLILLAFVLGLPLVLIVITTRKIAYVGWMLVYLFSLPIWNGILPAYAFWHFDDFTWGQTRMVDGEKADAEDGEKEGEFDSTHIVMKRWAEFEKERRWRNGIDSDEYKRHSLVSVDDSPYQASSGSSQSNRPPSRQKHDNTLLMLPPPLAVPRSTTSSDEGRSTRRSRRPRHRASLEPPPAAVPRHRRASMEVPLMSPPQAPYAASRPGSSTPPRDDSPSPSRGFAGVGAGGRRHNWSPNGQAAMYPGANSNSNPNPTPRRWSRTSPGYDD
ncbi:unnamed protein product [Mycena citricolor]|uniref:chitin synthase n=1 Tax=Mycena citricolor TaxID=2018698 RepID=A0AAD2K0V2_9AGAR|nr:unnamed protein product [Mycena citricolor]